MRLFSDMPLETANWLSDVANLVLIGSLIAGVIATFVVVRTGNVKEAHWDKLREKAAYAASEANARAEEAKAAAAEANARQKEAELKLAFLERKVIPRVINSEGVISIIEKLKPFPSTPFAIASDPAAEYGFVNSLIEILQKVGWKWQSYSASLVTLPLGNIGTLDADGSGVQIRINRARLADFKDAAQALTFALTGALRASVSLVIDPPNSSAACSPDAIHIEIRRKL